MSCSLVRAMRSSSSVMRKLLKCRARAMSFGVACSTFSNKVDIYMTDSLCTASGIRIEQPSSEHRVTSMNNVLMEVARWIGKSWPRTLFHGLIFFFSGTILSCGLHTCPSKCHQLHDHSKIKCEFIMDSKCLDGHRNTYKCHEQPRLTCSQCEREKKLAETKKQKALELQQKRDAEQLDIPISWQC